MAAKSTPVVPSNNDPLLLAIGDAMGRLVAEVDALGMSRGAAADKALERLLGRIEDLTVAAAALPATGLEGALVQFVALASHVSDLLAHTGDSAEEARIRRLLDNIATVLERATDIDAERFGGPFFLYRAARVAKGTPDNGNTHPDPKDSSPTH